MTDPGRRVPPRVLLVLAALAGLLGVLAPSASAAVPAGLVGGGPAGTAAATSGAVGALSPGLPAALPGWSARVDARTGVSRRPGQTSAGVRGATSRAVAGAASRWPAAAAGPATAVTASSATSPGGHPDVGLPATAAPPAPPLLLHGQLPRPPDDGVRTAELAGPYGRAPPAPAGT